MVYALRVSIRVILTENTGRDESRLGIGPVNSYVVRFLGNQEGLCVRLIINDTNLLFIVSILLIKRVWRIKKILKT
jgi:hypothetical protein